MKEEGREGERERQCVRERQWERATVRVRKTVCD